MDLDTHVIRWSEKKTCTFFSISALWDYSLGYHGGGGKGDQLLWSSCEHSHPHHCFWPRYQFWREMLLGLKSQIRVCTNNREPPLLLDCVFIKDGPFNTSYALKQATNYLYFPFSTVKLCCICSTFPRGTRTSMGTAWGSQTLGISDQFKFWQWVSSYRSVRAHKLRVLWNFTDENANTYTVWGNKDY